MADDILTEKKFTEFMETAMAFKPSKKPAKMLVWCEHCEDMTMLEAGKTECGHEPDIIEELKLFATRKPR